jgi:hypothetical protein
MDDLSASRYRLPFRAGGFERRAKENELGVLGTTRWSVGRWACPVGAVDSYTPGRIGATSVRRALAVRATWGGTRPGSALVGGLGPGQSR